MAEAPLTKYSAYIDEVAAGGHNHKTAVFKLALTDAAPNANTHTVWNTTVYPPPTLTFGYSPGGNTLTTSIAATASAVFTLGFADTVFAANSSGGIGPFRYAILYNSSASNKLVGFYDYGSSVSLGPTDTFTTDFKDVEGVLTIA